MPELPEVETIKNQLRKKLIGKKIKSVEIDLPKLVHCPKAEFREFVEDKKITKIWRRAKILGFDLLNGYSILFHLKLTGQLIYQPPAKKPGLKEISKNPKLAQTNDRKLHTHVIYHFTDGSKLLHNDVRQFGYEKLFKTADLSKYFAKEKIGPEPLNKNFDLKKIKEILHTRPKAAIKPALMDPKFIAGIGNIYADEILFFAGVHPLRKINALTDEEIRRLHQGIQNILKEAIQYKGSSMNDYVDAFGKEGNFVPRLKVYGKEGEKCYKCKSEIKRLKIGGRSAYFCPECQK